MLKKAIRFISLSLVLVIFIAAIPLHTSAAEESFLIGTCCHHTSEYRTNWEDIVYYNAKMGSKIIRIDLGDTDAKLWDPFFAFCKAYGIEVQGIVYNTESAEWFSKRYGKQIKYMQILNERDAYCIISGDGKNKDEYNMNKIAETAALLKDIIPIVRENSPKTKIIVNMTWTHYGFIEHMIEQDVEIDVVGIDWYSHMEKNYGLNNALDDLKERFGKPIFICEANQWQNSGVIEENDEKMGAQNISYIEICKAKQKSHNIVGYTVYELLNEITKGKSNGESYFGLIYLKSDLKIDKPKAAYYEIQEYLGYKNKNVKKIPLSSLDLTQYGPVSSDNGQTESSDTTTTSSETSSVNTVIEPITITQTEYVTEQNEVVKVITEEPETIETVTTKNVYKTKGFPVWLIIELVGCAIVTAGIITLVFLKRKYGKNKNGS